jgi:hypothetical protein
LLKESTEPLTHVFMRQVIASVEGVLPMSYFLFESGFVFEILDENVLQELVRFPALPFSRPCEPFFQFRDEMNFHG